MRKCKVCGQDKQLDMFQSIKGRYRSWTCTSCVYQRRKAQGNAQPPAAARKKWKNKNRDKVAEQSRRYRDRLRGDAWTQDKITAYWRAHKEDRRRTREARIAEARASKPWNAPGLTIAERARIRRKLDPGYALYDRMRQRKRRKDRGMTITMAGLVRGCLLGTRKTSVSSHLPCSTDELKAYIESLFTDGMSWSAFADGDIHIDHKVPLSKFELSNEIEAKAAWSIKNLQPLWAADNLKKRDRCDYGEARNPNNDVCRVCPASKCRTADDPQLVRQGLDQVCQPRQN